VTTIANPPKLRPVVWLRQIVRLVFFPVALLWPAGTWSWWEAWALVGVWMAFGVAMTVFLSGHDPALLAERMKGSPVQDGQKAWDKVLMLLIFAAGVGLFMVPGFDVMRFGCSARLPIWVEIVALAMHVPSFVFIAWVLRENTYLSRVVKIDEEREHHVITTGPYALVRHPMYSAILVIVFALPVALGSRFGLIPAALMVVLLMVRTYFEDRTLHAELPGYPGYANQTRYRLIPWVW
jgi:protein-S-isoprenylcysteine O-methyltransferase Ste14